VEQQITYRLSVYFSDPDTDDVDVLALDSVDMRYVLEMEPGYVLRMS
jgi:hypothetical protein